jgi:nitrous oxidase accessory protein
MTMNAQKTADDKRLGERGIQKDSPPSSLSQQNRPRDFGRAETLSRWLLLVAAAALLVSPLLPYWHMKLAAPQYPKGLSLVIYPDRVQGDVREIDGLNHYIGMRKIDDAAKVERRLGVGAIAGLGACLIIAALWRSRWAVLLAVPTILFPPLFLADLYWWLRDSGLNLDPHAALSSSIKPFVPQVLGAGKIAQFATDATLGTGYYLSLFAAAACLFFCYARLRSFRPQRSLTPREGSRSTGIACGAVIGVLLFGRLLAADTIVVQSNFPSASLVDALARARNGDTIVVRGGVHHGPLVVRKSVRLIGELGPVVDGRGQGTVVRLEAPGSELRGFVIRSSGSVLEREDVGVLVAAPDVRIEGNSLEDVLFGIYVRQAPRSVIRGNQLHGKDLAVPRRGDLIRVWYSDDVTIEANTTAGGRDVVLWYSNHLTLRDNQFHGGRYGLHFMYCQDATITDNLLRDNSVGAFLMYSERLRLRKNLIASNRGVSGYGIGLKDMMDCQVTDNVLADNKAGIFAEGCRGSFAGNLLVGNDKGIVLFPSAMGNRIEANAFVDNGEQVAIEGLAGIMTTNTWRGNFWSDYRGYDRDGDGYGDLAYRPVRLFERLSDRNPALRLFADNPSASAIDFASRVFPIFEPKPKFVDERPLMRPSPPPVVVAGVADARPWLVVGLMLLVAPFALIIVRSVQGDGSVWVQRGGSPRAAGLERASETLTSSTANHSSPAISVDGLTKRFANVTAVDDLCFEIRPTEAVALWGPNGAGKTTVLRCLLGLLPFEGTAHVLGLPCGPRGRASRRLLGYVPQEVRLHADQTVGETIRFYARLRRVGSLRVKQLIDDWELGDVERRPVRNLSGGMKQKVALVIALLSDPPILLLDEPTSNLDARARREFSDLLETLKSAGKTLLFCTHRPSEVWRLADRVIVLERGRLLSMGPPERVREHLLEPAQLCLFVPIEESAAAAARLEEGGFDARRNGSRIWVDAAAGRRLEALELLGRAGIRILDFDLESERASTSPVQPE